MSSNHAERFLNLECSTPEINGFREFVRRKDVKEVEFYVLRAMNNFSDWNVSAETRWNKEREKKEAIGFKKWSDERGYLPKQKPDTTIPQWGWVRQENQITWSKWISDEQLYSLYLESKK